MNQNKTKGPVRILVIQLRQLGDILLTTPILESLKSEYPGCTIHFLSHPMGKAILHDHPHVDKLFLDSGNFSLKTLRSIRKEKYDFVFDFMNNPRSALYSIFSKSPRKIAFQSKRSIAYTETVPRIKNPMYIVDEKHQLLQAIGCKQTGFLPFLPWESEDIETYNTLLKKEHFRDAPLRIILSPTHRRAPRKWPAESYGILADRLASEWNACILWAWGPGERSEVESLQQGMSHPSLLIPDTSLKQFAALCANCDLFIGNSNGPSHIAVSSGICTLQLHGHTDSRSWCPPHPHHRAIQAPDFGKVEIPDLGEVRVHDVWKELNEFYPIIIDKKRTSSVGSKHQWKL